MSTTELVILTLKPESNIGDPNNAAAKSLQKTLETLSKQEGCRQVHFGMVMEDSSKLRLLIDWESLPKHKEFMASEAYGPFLANIKTMIAGPPKIVHVDFKPAGALDKVLKAPVTEIVNFYFDEDVPADYDDGVHKVAGLEGQISGSKGIAWGTTYEIVEHEGVKGKAAVTALGWTDTDAQEAFGQTAAAKDVISNLRSSSKASTKQYIQAMKYEG